MSDLRKYCVCRSPSILGEECRRGMKPCGSQWLERTGSYRHPGPDGHAAVAQTGAASIW